MKCIRFMSALAALLVMLPLQAAPPKMKQYTNSTLRLSYPEYLNIKETGNSVMFARPGDASALSVYGLNAQCGELLSEFDSTMKDQTLITFCKSYLQTISEKFIHFNSKEPIRIENREEATYSCSYTAITANGKSVNGYLLVTIHNQCMIFGIIQNEDPTVYAQLVASLNTLQTTGSSNRTQTSSTGSAADTEQTDDFVPLRKIYKKDGLKMYYPEKMSIAEVTHKNRKEVIFTYTGGGAAVMNLNYFYDDEYDEIDSRLNEDFCQDVVNEMFTNVSKIYTEVKGGSIQSYPLPYLNRYMDFNGKILSEQKQGRLIAFYVGKTFVYAILQGDNKQKIDMLTTIIESVESVP